jgi:hypothetical protein
MDQTTRQQLLTIVTQHAEQIQLRDRYADTKLAFMRFFSETLLIFLLQYTGLVISSVEYQMPIQFAAGTACAFIFLRGYSVLPGIWLGSLAAYLFIHSHNTHVLLSATILTLQTALIYWLSCRLRIPTLIFYQKKSLVKFIGCAVLVVSLSSIIIDRHQWLVYCLANLNGIFIISFALIAWDAFYPQIDLLKKQRKFPLYFSFTLLVSSVVGILITQNAFCLFSFIGLNLLIILFIKYKYGWCGAVSALFASGILLNFTSQFLFVPYSLLSLQVFIFLEALIVIS